MESGVAGKLAMARYYFHTVIGPVHIHDYYGSDLHDEGAARRRQHRKSAGG